MRRGRWLASAGSASFRKVKTKCRVRKLPVAALAGLERETVVALSRAGLKTIGDLADRPPQVLAARFGQSLITQLMRTLGREDARLTPLRPLPIVAVERRFAEPLSQVEALEAVIASLIEEAVLALQERNEGGRAFEASLFRSDGNVRRLTVETGRPSRDAATILKLYRERLAALADPIDAGFGFDVIRLAVSVAEPLDPLQPCLDGNAIEDEAIGDLVDRLIVRFGRDRVLKFEAQDTYDPSREGRLISAENISPRDIALRNHISPGLGLNPASPRSSASAVRSAAADRASPSRSTGRPAEAFSLAARGARYRTCGGAGTYRAGMVAKEKRRAGSRLLPRRGRAGLPLLDLSPRSLWRGRSTSTLVLAWRVRVMSYAEFATSTNFSFLRGASPARDLVLTALLLGHRGIGIADRNTVAGVVRAYSALEDLKKGTVSPAPGIDADWLRERAKKFKLAVGTRLVFSDGTPDILAYPKNRDGWGNLTRLLTLGNGRAKKGDCILALNDLLAHAQELCLSSCRTGAWNLWNTCCHV